MMLRGHNPKKVPLWARENRPLPTRWLRRHPGRSKSDDAALRCTREVTLADFAKKASGPQARQHAGGEQLRHPAHYDAAAAPAQGRSISDDEHEAACGRLRAALSTMDTKNPETWQRLILENREPGWPDPLEMAQEAATTPRGALYDAADGRGGRGGFFRSLLPGPWRHLIELNFDIALSSGVRFLPSMLIRHAAHNARVHAQMFAGTPEGRELQIVADLFEQYPAEAVDYAAEWAATFDQRCGGAR